MNDQLAAIKRGEDPAQYAGEYGSRPLYRMLGYFSIIGLLRVHCLLGDFTLALQTLDDIELSKKAVFARVMAAHFTTYYYVGFSYMMLRRYADAIKAFSHILIYVSRTKNFHKQNAQFDSITKKNDQMYALLAMCVALSPTRLDDTIHTAMREKYGDQFAKLQRGGPESLPVFEELFLSACPKFISPIPPDWDNSAVNVEPSQHHLQVFMADVKNAMVLGPTIKSYLKLYTTVDLSKLAAFLDVDKEELRSQLLVFKQRSRQTRWVEGGLVEGEIVNTSDVDFALKGVHTFPSRNTFPQAKANVEYRISSKSRKQRSAESLLSGTSRTLSGLTNRMGTALIMVLERLRVARRWKSSNLRLLQLSFPCFRGSLIRGRRDRVEGV